MRRAKGLGDIKRARSISALRNRVTGQGQGTERRTPNRLKYEKNSLLKKLEQLEQQRALMEKNLSDIAQVIQSEITRIEELERERQETEEQVEKAVSEEEQSAVAREPEAGGEEIPSGVATNTKEETTQPEASGIVGKQPVETEQPATEPPEVPDITVPSEEAMKEQEQSMTPEVEKKEGEEEQPESAKEGEKQPEEAEGDQLETAEAGQEQPASTQEVAPLPEGAEATEEAKQPEETTQPEAAGEEKQPEKVEEQPVAATEQKQPEEAEQKEEAKQPESEGAEAAEEAKQPEETVQLEAAGEEKQPEKVEEQPVVATEEKQPEAMEEGQPELAGEEETRPEGEQPEAEQQPEEPEQEQPEGGQPEQPEEPEQERPEGGQPEAEQQPEEPEQEQPEEVGEEEPETAREEEQKRKFEVNLGIGKLSFGDIFQGVGSFIDLVSHMAEEREERREGEFTSPSGRVRAVYGFSVQKGLGGKPSIEPFGNVKKTAMGPVVEEERRPLVDVFDEKDHVVVIAELPGIDGRQIHTEIKGDVLILSASSGERRYASEVVLPQGIDASTLTSKYKNGILELKISKA